jgi:hypothetical protein
MRTFFRYQWRAITRRKVGRARIRIGGRALKMLRSCAMDDRFAERGPRKDEAEEQPRP